MRIGVQIQLEGTSYSEVLTAALAADLMGVDSVYVWDHVAPIKGEKSLEAWTVLASLCDVTDECRLGSLVSPIGLRNPVMLAEMALTVNEISNGRVVLGLGSGWHRPDYDTLGILFGTARSRSYDLAQAVPKIHTRLDGKLPILIGGGGQTAMRMAVQYGDIWHSFSKPADLRAVLYRHSFGDIERSVYCSDDYELASNLRAAGADEIVFSWKHPYKTQWLERWLEWRDEQ